MGKASTFALSLLLSFSAIQQVSAADFVLRTGQILQYDGMPFELGEVRCGSEKSNFDPSGAFKIICPINSGLTLRLVNGSFSNFTDPNSNCVNSAKDSNYVNWIYFDNSNDYRNRITDPNAPLVFKLPKPTLVRVEVVDAQNNPLPNYTIRSDTSLNHYLDYSGGTKKTQGEFPLGYQIPWRCGFMSSKDATNTFAIYPGASSLRSNTSIYARVLIDGKAITKSLDLEFSDYQLLKFCIPINFGATLDLPDDCTEKVLAKAAAEKAAAEKAAAEKAAAEKAAAEKAAAEKAAAEKAAAEKDFAITQGDADKLLLRLASLKKLFPFTKEIFNLEKKFKSIPLVLGSDLSTIKSNISSINLKLDSSEKIWAKTQKMSLVCVKGKLQKVIVAVQPKCPLGYKPKK
jgi:hypothetical protein